MIPKVYVHYVCRHPSGSYGVMMDNDELPFAVTLQPTDKFLVPGTYDCHQRDYHKGGYRTFEVIVEGHSDVLFHKGNHQEDSRLCFLIGEAFEIVEQRAGISQSLHAFTEFWDKYKAFDKIQLIVSAKEGI